MSEIIREYELKDINKTNIIPDENHHSLSQKDLLHNHLIEDNINENKMENPYNESENSREDYLPVNETKSRQKTSVIKGLLLAFIFFSVIIYSLLYLLTPEKKSNIIFEGNNINYSEKYIFQLDNMIKYRNIEQYNLNISLYNYNRVIEEINDLIKLKDINLGLYIIIKNEILKLEIYNETNFIIENEINNYKNFSLNDFPFWICFFDKNNNIYNITSNNLITNLNKTGPYPLNYIFN